MPMDVKQVGSEGRGTMTAHSWDGQCVLVTGATGMLGSWLVKELLAHGARVVALVQDHRLRHRPLVRA